MFEDQLDSKGVVSVNPIGELLLFRPARPWYILAQLIEILLESKLICEKTSVVDLAFDRDMPLQESSPVLMGYTRDL